MNMLKNFVLKTWPVVIVAVWFTTALPALAASSTASSASDSASTSVGSLSDSVKKSSNSSSGDKEVAAGEYKIIDMAALAEQPGTMRLKLQALADPSEGGLVFLDVPQRALEQGRLAAGQIVTANNRPYGLEFAKADDGRAFFLALRDDWLRELPSRPVTL